MSAGLGRILQGRAVYRTTHAFRSSSTRASTGRVLPTTATTTARVGISQGAPLPQTQVRHISGTTTDAKSAAAAASSAVLNSTSTPSLRELFDSPPVSSSRSRLASSVSPEGLFLYPNLKTPETFLDSVNAAIARGHLLVERIAHAPEQQDGGQEMRKVIKLFDRLSDVLCKVIDAAEVVRCLHPDPAWRQAAETVYEELFSWMNTLNTDPRLYEVTNGNIFLTVNGTTPQLVPGSLQLNNCIFVFVVGAAYGAEHAGDRVRTFGGRAPSRIGVLAGF